MNTAVVVLSLATGLIVGALFASLGVPIPAPPTLAGVAGILGIYLGFRVVDSLGVGIDLLSILGIS
ncbi:MAG: XapX domain-containing protein [Halobacteriaceae archaeon]